MSEYVPKLDIWVTQMPMPIHVRGFCKHIGAEDCAIINEDLSDEAKLRAVEHEARHLMRNDLQSDEDTEELERNV